MDDTGTDGPPGTPGDSGSSPQRRPLTRPRRGLGSHRAAGEPTQGRSQLWRLATPLALLGAGALFVTSSVNSAGTDLRPSQYADLADLASQETDRVSALQERVAELTAEIEGLSEQQGSGAMTEIEAQIDELARPAGLTAVEGPGLTVTLEDAPESIRESAGDEVSDAIVHQQDIQAVVNALWAGGAEAMTLQGQRVISTTGIKCVGNTVLLHGVTYSPPYVVSAIGDPDELLDSLESSPYVQAYLEAVDRWRLGWDVEVEESIEAPAYEGTTDMRYARPVSGTAAGQG